MLDLENNMNSENDIVDDEEIIDNFVSLHKELLLAEGKLFRFWAPLYSLDALCFNF